MALGHLLERAGLAALEHFRAAPPRRKADGSPVTDADLAAEAVLVAGLHELFPGVAVCSEEGDPAEPEGVSEVLYVDPIDGTSAFVEQLAHWGPTVAMVRDGEPVFGALHLPRLGETWLAERSVGAFRDGHRLQPPALDQVRRSSMLYVPSRFHQIGRVAWPGKIRALGTTAVHLAQVAAGMGAATAIGTWSPWDIGFGALAVEEAGRVLTDLSGSPIRPLAHRGAAFLAGDPAAVAALAAALEDVQTHGH